MAVNVEVARRPLGRTDLMVSPIGLGVMEFAGGGGLVGLGFPVIPQEEKNATVKLREKNLDMIVANDVSAPGAGFGVDTNIVRLLYRDGTKAELPLLAKEEVASAILDRIVALRAGSD